MPMPHGHPNPILKRASSAQPDFDPFPHLLNPSVHFPPSPSLTRTFSAHSAAQYDRTPIQVAPNACALPARGCPGRTYYDSGARGAPKSSQQAVHPTTGRGSSLHPRALSAAYDAQVAGDDDDESEDTEAERTPTRTSPYIPLPVPPPIPNAHPNHFSVSNSYSLSAFSSSTTNYPMYLPPQPPPPLVPDLSSSDESDGFASPPPEPATGPPLQMGGKSAYAYYPAFQIPPGNAYPHPYAPSSGYPYAAPPTSPYSHSPYAAPSQSPPRHPTSQSPPRHRPRPKRPQTPFARAEVEDGYEEEDLPGEYSHAGAFAARGSPPRTKRESPPRERTRPSRSSAVEGNSPPRSSRSSAEGISPPRERRSRSSTSVPISSSMAAAAVPGDEREKRERKERRRSDKDKDKCRVGALCRSLAGASFRDAEGEGCLGGF